MFFQIIYISTKSVWFLTVWLSKVWPGENLKKNLCYTGHFSKKVIQCHTETILASTLLFYILFSNALRNSQQVVYLFFILIEDIMEKGSA